MLESILNIFRSKGHKIILKIAISNLKFSLLLINFSNINYIVGFL